MKNNVRSDTKPLKTNGYVNDQPADTSPKIGFVIDIGLNKRVAEGVSLQDAFQRFRKERVRENKLSKYERQRAHQEPRSEAFKQELREKFIETAKKYIGLPYAQRYHEPGTADYDSPLFLDCCGLTRRVLQDLHQEFGFKVGRWNQAYQFDTLPIVLSPEEARPGDLVFVEATYNSAKKKPQKHDIVHVEIFLGTGDNGEETLGARYQTGHIQVLPSYKFKSKNYEIKAYHFRSIETWLEGICKSHCPDHPWIDHDSNSGFNPAGKRSIFSANACLDQDVNAEEDLSEEELREAPIFFVSKGNNWPLVANVLEKWGWRRLPFNYHFRQDFDLKWVQLRSEIDFHSHREGQLVNHIPNNTVITSKMGLLTCLRESNNGELPWFSPETYRLDVPSEALEVLKKHKESEEQGTPLVWIVKPAHANCGRGVELIATRQKLLAVCFPDRTQPDCSSSTNQTLQEPVQTVNSGESEINSCAVPSQTSDKETLLVPEAAKIACRDSPCGLGSYDVRSVKKEQSPAVASGSNHFLPSLEAAICQRYITNPLLIEGRKFDMRVYMLIARTSPYLVYFHNGYVRLSLEDYSSTDFDNRFAHLTNAAVQYKHPDYKQKAGENIWSMDQLADYFVTKGMNTMEYFCNQLPSKMKQVMVEVFNSAKDKLDSKLGFFDLLGCDFMLTDQFELQLLEINTNPAMHTTAPVLQQLLPQIIEETLRLVLRAHSCKRNDVPEPEQDKNDKNDQISKGNEAKKEESKPLRSVKPDVEHSTGDEIRCKHMMMETQKCGYNDNNNQQQNASPFELLVDETIDFVFSS